MPPCLWIQSGPVPSYTLCVGAGFAAGAVITWIRGRREGLDFDTVFSLLLLTSIVGLAGARAWYVATHLSDYEPWFRAFPSAGMEAGAGLITAAIAAALLGLYARRPLRPLGPFAGTLVVLSLAGIAGLLGARVAALRAEFQDQDPFLPSGGGLAFFGALASASAACALFCAVRRVSFPRAADAAAPGVLVGCAAGRIGCWIGGCCTGSVLGAPTQIIEAVLDGTLAAALCLRKVPAPGRTATAACLGYAAIRFGLEFARADVAPVVLGLTPSQLAAMTLAAAATAWAARQSPHTAEPA